MAVNKKRFNDRSWDFLMGNGLLSIDLVVKKGVVF